jgi:polyhydroxybutyrate depolymerase
VKDWAMLDGCSLTPDTSSPPLDLDTQIPGAETTVATYVQGCKPGGSATLWTIQGGSHLPSIGDTFRQDVFAFLKAHAKP